MSKVQRVRWVLRARPRELVFLYSLRLIILKIAVEFVYNHYGIEE